MRLRGAMTRWSITLCVGLLLIAAALVLLRSDWSVLAFVAFPAGAVLTAVALWRARASGTLKAYVAVVVALPLLVLFGYVVLGAETGGALVMNVGIYAMASVPVALVAATFRERRAAIWIVLSYALATLLWSTMIFHAGSHLSDGVTQRPKASDDSATLMFKIEGGDSERYSLDVGESIYLAVTIFSTVAPGGIVPQNGTARLFVGLESACVLVLVVWVLGLAAWRSGWATRPQHGRQATGGEDKPEDDHRHGKCRVVPVHAFPIANGGNGAQRGGVSFGWLTAAVFALIAVALAKRRT